MLVLMPPAPSIGGALAAGQAPEEYDMSELAQVRRSYRSYWDELEASGVDGLERFASVVQRIVDTRAAEGSPRAVRLVLDDLVDLFVSPEHSLEKTLVMSTPAVLGDQAIDEDEESLEGFAPPFDAGEGRFRHFALNAAASFAAPEELVDLAARLRGGDMQGAGADSRGDVATNRVGQEFARLLQERGLDELAGTDAVHEWLLERFGDGQQTDGPL